MLELNEFSIFKKINIFCVYLITLTKTIYYIVNRDTVLNCLFNLVATRPMRLGSNNSLK